MKTKEQIAKSFIENNIYLTLATVSRENKPWASPVYYCFDENFNFYFISKPNSQHIRNIMDRPNVSFAIFDSHQEEGTGNGVQGSGEVVELTGDELHNGLKYYKTSFIELTPESLSEPDGYRLYKLNADTFYILQPQGNSDDRVDVNLV